MTPGFVLVAHVDESGLLQTLEVTPDCVPAARERGWMVWTDFEVAYESV